MDGAGILGYSQSVPSRPRRPSAGGSSRDPAVIVSSRVLFMLPFLVFSLAVAGVAKMLSG